jgi:flagellar capping protein FliD
MEAKLLQQRQDFEEKLKQQKEAWQARYKRMSEAFQELNEQHKQLEAAHSALDKENKLLK